LCWVCAGFCRVGSTYATPESVLVYAMVDVEADGPIPGDYSMVSFGAVLVEEALNQTFYGRLRPISEKWVPQALAVSGFSREKTRLRYSAAWDGGRPAATASCSCTLSSSRLGMATTL
jgi:hypothetical protein